jgi:hypothetical protein
MEYKLEVLSPILAGLSNDYFGFRVFTKIDFSDFRIVSKIKLTSEDIVGHEKEMEEKGRDVVLKEIYEKKKETIEKELLKLGYIKLGYLFPRRHFNIDSIKTKDDYVNWIDYLTLFSRGIVFTLEKEHKIRVKILEFKPVNVSLGVHLLYYDNVKIVVAYEAILPGSLFSITFDSKVEPGIVVSIGRLRKFGFGKVVIKE